MELKDIVSLFRRRIWILVAGLVIGLIFGLLVSWIQAPVYEASARVLVARSHQQGSTDILALSDQQLVSTYQQLLKTQPVLDAAGSQVGTKIDPTNVRGEVIPNTQIIRITVDDRNAAQAAAVANSLVQILIAQNETLQAGRYGAYEDGLNSQITQVQAEIAALQGQITQKDQANIQEQLSQVNEQITALQGEIADLEKEIAKVPSYLTTADRATVAAKQSQIDQLRSMLLLYQQIQTNLTYIGKPMQAGSTLNDPQVAALQSTLNLYQQLYLSLLNNLEQVKLARVQSTPTVSPIENAALPRHPVRPLPLLYTALGAIVGLLLSAAVILLMDYFDDSLRTSHQVQEVLHAPVIGQISDRAPKANWYRRKTTPEQKVFQLDNSFGALRINLERRFGAKAPKTMLVTSAGRAEGKTTVATNLARSFVHSGKKVILVDADLQHPQIHVQLDLENRLGLVDTLSNGADWQEISCIRDGLTVITSGIAMPAQSRLLESDRMTDLMMKLQKNADVVIVDGPPMFVVNAQVLASRVGGVLLVVEYGCTKASTARPLREQLDLMNLNVLGVVMNRVPASDLYYGTYQQEAQSEKPKENPVAVQTAQS
jgi:capsular exopolysaccharide synthesis family protein